jgi:uncharacterized protein
MSDAVVAQAATRIAQHAESHGRGSVRIVFHGGEPLLGGAKRLVDLSTAMREIFAGRTKAAFTVQTNGTLLDTEALELLLQAGIRVGVSLDGGRADFNRHRLKHDGRPSYDDVQQALRRLSRPPFSRIYAGLLCTIDLNHDPIAVYESLLDHTPPMIDFLLPHANWTRPPPVPSNPGNAVPYATWLIEVFERWFTAPSPETRIRMFEGLISGVTGNPRRGDQVGALPPLDVVIETDGRIEQTDALKSAYPGAAATGLNIVDHSFDDAIRHPGIQARRVGIEGLSRTCQACEVVGLCGGGHYAHRYRSGGTRPTEADFRHPSVYCDDLLALIRHVRSRTLSSMARASAGT